MKKFAFVSHVLPPSPSGQAVVIFRLLREFDPEEYVLISIGRTGSCVDQNASLTVRGRCGCAAEGSRKGKDDRSRRPGVHCTNLRAGGSGKAL